jgi:hypothetical protein
VADAADGVTRGRHARSSAGAAQRTLTARAARGTLAGLVVGLLVTVARPAGAQTSTTGGLQAQASAIASQLAADNRQLDALGEQYLAARSDYLRASTAARQTSVVVQRIGRVLVHDRAAVAAAAIGAYVNAGSTTDLGSFLVQKPDNVAVEQTYLRYAEGKLSAAIASYENEQASLGSSLAVERHDASVAKAALLRTETARATVLGTLGRERQLYDSVQGELARLVAAQLAARQAAELKAQAAKAAAANQAGPPSLSGTMGIGTSPIPNGSLSQDFAALRNCESSGDYQTDTGNGYYGAYQFSLSTWLGLGETGLPNDASPGVQDAAAYLLYQRDGWGPWPACSAALGL